MRLSSRGKKRLESVASLIFQIIDAYVHRKNWLFVALFFMFIIRVMILTRLIVAVFVFIEEVLESAASSGFLNFDESFGFQNFFHHVWLSDFVFLFTRQIGVLSDQWFSLMEISLRWWLMSEWGFWLLVLHVDLWKIVNVKLFNFFVGWADHL